MEMKDYITITISGIALFFSFVSLIFTFLNYKRNATKLKIEQLHFVPNPFGTKITPNKLFLDRKQSADLWTSVPILHLVVYLKISNLSYSDITISSIIINNNNEFLVSKINAEKMQEELALSFFASEKCRNRDLEKYGHAVPMSAMTLDSKDYSLINLGDRIESKSSIEGVIVISGNWDLYNAVNDGRNKLTIVTRDKKIDTYIEIDKTVIPNFSKV